MHLHRRAVARRRVELDPAAAVAGDARHRREAEPGARARRLRAEERLERALGGLGVHPAAVVGDAQAQVETGRDVVVDGLVGGQLDLGGGHGDGAAAGLERVARVDHEVDQHLLDVGDVGGYVRRLRVQLVAQLDVARQRAAQQPVEVLDHDVGVEHLGARELPLAEDEQPAHEPRAAARRVLDLGEVLLREVVLRQVLAHHRRCS